MRKVLYITANPKPAEASYSLQIANAFVEEYKAKHPEDEVVQLDLYKENLHFLTMEDLGTLFAPDKSGTENHPLLQYVHQFAAADKYIFSFPMWNFGVPAVLKAYIDLVSVVGITFKYTATGAVGLLENKKAVLVAARGGAYNQPPMDKFEFAANYMQAILGLFGVADTQTIAADCTNVQGMDITAIVGQATQKAKEIAAAF